MPTTRTQSIQLNGRSPGAVEPQDSTMETIHHQPRRKKEGLRPVKMTVNLTSMIDVIFQLLIYFIVTAQFTIGEGVLTAKLPQGPGKPRPDTTPPDKPLNIIVQSAGADGIGYRLSIGGLADPESFKQLSHALSQLQYAPERSLNGPYKPDNPVIIKPDGNVRWQHVVNTFNAAIKARYSNIQFAQAGQ